MEDPRYFLGLSKLYDELCDEYSHSHNAVGWFSRQTQSKRFEVLLDMPDLEGSSVLDVGCGQGDLYDYIQMKKHNLQYHGIDISEKMIQYSQKTHPGVSFKKANILDIHTPYDYIVASGAFSYRSERHFDFVRNIVAHMVKLAKKGIAVNVLSLLAPLEEQDHRAFYYFQPEEVLKLGLEFSDKIKLRHDYLPNDMTLFIFK